jgi:hypothetical protein
MELVFQLAGIVQLLATLALLFMLGQGVLYVLAGRNRDRNLVYQLLQVVTRPVLRFTRWMTPRVVVDRHIPFVAFLLVGWIWIILAVWVLPDLACSLGKAECTTLGARK